MAATCDVFMASDKVREAEKAVLYNYARERDVWVPKSIMEIRDGVVYVPAWFARKNGIGRFNQVAFRVS